MIDPNHLSPTPIAPPAESSALQDWLRPVEQFLYHEARLLDLCRYDEWLSLFAEEGTYWIPTMRGQTDPLNVPSIIYENKDILRMRVARLADEDTYLAAPRPYTAHFVSNISVEPLAHKEITVHSCLMVLEFCEEKRRTHGGLCTHVLRSTDNGLQIVSKKVDLLDCDGVHAPFLSLL